MSEKARPQDVFRQEALKAGFASQEKADLKEREERLFYYDLKQGYLYGLGNIGGVRALVKLACNHCSSEYDSLLKLRAKVSDLESTRKQVVEWLRFDPTLARNLQPKDWVSLQDWLAKEGVV